MGHDRDEGKSVGQKRMDRNDMGKGKRWKKRWKGKEIMTDMEKDKGKTIIKVEKQGGEPSSRVVFG